MWKFAGWRSPRCVRRNVPFQFDQQVIRTVYVHCGRTPSRQRGKRPEVGGEIVDILDQLAREGARLMLERALSAEVDEFLGRQRYARGDEFRGYCSGYGRSRTVGIGTWAVPVRAPRVSDVPMGDAGFQSVILPKRKRPSLEIQSCSAGSTWRDSRVGTLSPSSGGCWERRCRSRRTRSLRLKEDWEQEYEAWRQRSLELERFVYV